MKNFENENGSIVIIVAISITLLLTLSALVIDIGSAYIITSQVQSAADAAAFSAGKLLPVKETDTIKISNIEQVAKDYAIKNGISASSIIDVNLQELTDGYYKSLSVEIISDHNYNFAKIIGLNQVTIDKKAKVNVMPISSTTGVTPIGIEINQFKKAQETGALNDIVLKYGGGDGTNGVFGFIVLDDSNGNANTLLKWMSYGYEGILSAGDILPNATGNKASVAKQGVDYRIGLCSHYPENGGCSSTKYVEDCPKIVKCLIYKQLNDREIEIVGFAAFLLEGVDEQANITGSYLNIQMSGQTGSNALNTGLYGLKLIE